MSAFDREQAREVLRPYISGFGYTPSPAAEAVLDALERCVRPASGVILTPQEARTAAAWYTGDLRDDEVNELALAERLETA